jgi:hypothetical protein
VLLRYVEGMYIPIYIPGRKKLLQQMKIKIRDQPRVEAQPTAYQNSGSMPWRHHEKCLDFLLVKEKYFTIVRKISRNKKNCEIGNKIICELFWNFVSRNFVNHPSSTVVYIFHNTQTSAWWLLKMQRVVNRLILPSHTSITLYYVIIYWHCYTKNLSAVCLLHCIVRVYCTVLQQEI